MTRQNDYSETRACLVRARDALHDAQRVASRTNLPPTAMPGDIRQQIDVLEDIVADVHAEISAAREACSREGRQGLTLV